MGYLDMGLTKAVTKSVRVKSSCIESISFDPYDGNPLYGDLEVQVKGHTYEYGNVPLTVYQQFISASSKGAFWDAHIKNVY